MDIVILKIGLYSWEVFYKLLKMQPHPTGRVFHHIQNSNEKQWKDFKKVEVFAKLLVRNKLTVELQKRIDLGLLAAEESKKYHKI